MESGLADLLGSLAALSRSLSHPVREAVPPPCRVPNMIGQCWHFGCSSPPVCGFRAAKNTPEDYS